MVSSKSNRNRDGTSSSSSSMSESTIVLLIAVAMVSFFAGTIFTVHMNMDCVGGGIRDGGLGEQHHINVKVEELAQKRILGMYIICVDNTAIQFIIEYDAVFCRLETSFYVKKSKFMFR